MQGRDQRAMLVALEDMKARLAELQRCTAALLASHQRVYEACDAWLREFDDGSLGEAVDAMREACLRGREHAATARDEVVRTLAQLSASTTLQRAEYDRLVVAASRLLVLGLLPLVSALERAGPAIATFRALLGSALAPAVPHHPLPPTEKPAKLTVGFADGDLTEGLRNCLVVDAQSVKERMADFTAPVHVPLDPWPRIDWDCDDEEFRTTFDALKKAAAVRLQAADAHAGRLAERAAAYVYCCPNINPLLVLHERFAATFASPRAELEEERGEIAQAMDRIADDLELIGSALRSMLEATGE